MKFGDFSWNLTGIHLQEITIEIRIAFCSASTFSWSGVIFLYFFCWNNKYIDDNIIRVSIQKV